MGLRENYFTYRVLQSPHNKVNTSKINAEELFQDTFPIVTMALKVKLRSLMVTNTEKNVIPEHNASDMRMLLTICE